MPLPLKAALLAIATRLVGVADTTAQTHAIYMRAEYAADAAIEAAELEVVDPDRRAAWARAVFTWSFFESGWQSDPKGSNDDGGACGAAQVHVASLPAGLVPAAWTCTALRKDVVLSLRAALRLLLWFEARCGTMTGALNAFSTNGMCAATPIALVSKRCTIAGCTTSE